VFQTGKAFCGESGGAGQKLVGVMIGPATAEYGVLCLEVRGLAALEPLSVAGPLARLLAASLEMTAALRQDRARLLAVLHRQAKAAEPTSGTASLDHLIGLSRGMHGVRMGVMRLSASRGSVLLQGETGTGKGLCARILHSLSPRKAGPFLRIDCASVEPQHAAAWLFGVEKAGTQSERKGVLETLVGGTLFLDDVDLLPPALWPGVRRLQEDREIERVGGGKRIKADIRILAASTGPRPAALDKILAAESLFLPPLRHRPEDIPLLVDAVLQKLARDGRRCRLDPAAMTALLAHPFPGNIRELAEVIHAVAQTAEKGVIRADAVRQQIGFSLPWHHIAVSAPGSD